MKLEQALVKIETLEKENKKLRKQVDKLEKVVYDESFRDEDTEVETLPDHFVFQVYE